MKKDYVKFHKRLKKKSNLISFVCYESNIVDVNHNTWWIDFGFTTHISNSLQGLMRSDKHHQWVRLVFGLRHLLATPWFINNIKYTQDWPKWQYEFSTSSRGVTIDWRSETRLAKLKNSYPRGFS